MKKLIVTIVLVGVVLLLAFTCPDKQAHKDAIDKVVSGVVDSKLDELDSGTGDVLTQGLSMLGSMFAAKMVDTFLDNRLTVDNYVVCSIGKIKLDDKTKTVSFGILNNVFTMSEEDVKENLKKLGQDL